MEIDLELIVSFELWRDYRNITTHSPSMLGPDYMSRVGPVSRAGSVCRDDFQPGITWARLAGLARFAEMTFSPVLA